LCPRGRAAAIASDRPLQSWYVVVEFCCVFSWCFVFPFLHWFFLSGVRIFGFVCCRFQVFEVVALLRVLGLVLCSCSRMVMLLVLSSVAWIALEVYVFLPVI